eukprot:m.24359 g.24359  ORF g.24359 m.24359 type:complete len:179 (+) comp9107_c0_seq1:159-695(+)
MMMENRGSTPPSPVDSDDDSDDPVFHHHKHTDVPPSPSSRHKIQEKERRLKEGNTSAEEIWKEEIEHENSTMMTCKFHHDLSITISSASDRPHSAPNTPTVQTVSKYQSQSPRSRSRQGSVKTSSPLTRPRKKHMKPPTRTSIKQQREMLANSLTEGEQKQRPLSGSNFHKVNVSHSQ